jgi:hypothetical protein
MAEINMIIRLAEMGEVFAVSEAVNGMSGVGDPGQVIKLFETGDLKDAAKLLGK